MKRIIITALILFSGLAYAQDYTIVVIPDQDEEIAKDTIKYDITHYKTLKDINDKDFTVVDKVERIDLHQLNFDIVQEQAKIDNANEVLINSPLKIAEINEMIKRLK